MSARSCVLHHAVAEYHRVWISSADAAAVAGKGFKLVHAPSDYFYLVRGNKFYHDHHINRSPRIVEEEDGLATTQLETAGVTHSRPGKR